MASSTAKLLPSISIASRRFQSCPFPANLTPKTLLSFSSSIRAPSVSLVSSRNSQSPVAVAAGTRHLIGSITKTEGLRFHDSMKLCANLLLEGALEIFRRYSVHEEDITVVKVPGSFEIPVVAQKLGKSGDFHAILCIGAVVRGDTTHYDAVANSAASGVLSAGLGSGTPCIFGVLTSEDMDQALNRAGGKAGNEGAEAALTAIEMASLFEHHLK